MRQRPKILFIFLIILCKALLSSAAYSEYKITPRFTNIGAATGVSASYNLRGLGRVIYLRVISGPNFIIGEGFLKSVYFAPTVFAPLVTGISPSTGQNTGTVAITDLAGANFQSGATVKLSKSGQADISATGITVVSAGKITCAFDLTGAAAGLWDITVTNADGRSGVLPSAFTISQPAPTVSSVIPAKATNTESTVAIRLAGENFLSDATITLSKIGESDIAGTSVSIISRTSASCNLNILDKTPGAWDVNLTNSDGQKGTLALAFKIEAPEITITKPVEFEVLPNPDIPSVKMTSIKYELSKDANVTIDIYNMYGEKIWSTTVAAGTTGGQVGENQAIWNGLTSFKTIASAGVYIVFIYGNSNGETKLLSKQKIGIVK